VSETALVDHAPGIEHAFAGVPEERSLRLERIRGELPRFLRGTYYLNGPARFERGGQRYRHWLDGDGMVCALRFSGGDPEGAHLTARFVRSAKWTAEEEAGRPLFRTFGTAFPGDRLVRGIALESPVNVSIVPFAGTLLALGEQGLPWELDPETLETRGNYTFGGGLNPVTPFAAHAKIDPQSGELWNFGVNFASAQPSLNLYRFSPEGSLLERRRTPLDLPCSLHDFCLTPTHAVFHLGPYLLDMEGMARQGRTVMDSLTWEPERGTRLLLLPREPGQPALTIPVGSRYCLHTINGFQEGDHLIVDVVELDRPVYDQYQEVPDLFTEVSPGRPVRFRIDLAKGELAGVEEIAYDRAPDFPAIDPHLVGKPYDDLWMLGISATGHPGRKFFDQLVHATWSNPHHQDLWQAPPGHYLGGEPAFAPDPDRPGDGAVICQLFNATQQESAFAVFDARKVGEGPVAVLPLESPLHLGFHGVFHPDEG
jgi:carotenoid cleavage dioxygenase-like enzyme